ncbi:hypothetical protein D3C72_1742940 [compost metagenome]
MGVGPQRIHVTHHPIHSLHQFPDLGFVTKRTDCANHCVLAFDRKGVAEQQPAVTVNLLILQCLTRLRYPAQRGEHRNVMGHFRAVGWQKQNLAGGVVNHCHATLTINSNHAFLQGLQHRLALFKQSGNFVRFKAKQNAFQ